jgi:large subunit ribosomal protein L6
MNFCMSRIGKQPIAIPAKVKVEVKGAEGFSRRTERQARTGNCPSAPAVKVDGANVDRQPRRRRRAGQGAARLEPRARQQHGQGRDRRLQSRSWRFRASVSRRLSQGKRREPAPSGSRHPIDYTIPDQIKVTVEENTKLDH